MTVDSSSLESVHPSSRSSDGHEQKSTPLPKFQLFIIWLINLAEPLAGCVIYPFINKLVRETGIINGDEKKTGYYAGIIESAFFLAECFTVVQWGYLSDRIGRKSVLVFGPLGLSLAVVGFGLSKGFWALVMFRCIQGAFNGNIGVSKSVIAEIADSTNIGKAYSVIPIAWSMGMTVGPLIGGYFANPADRWPNTLGRIALLQTYPYFLPCATISFLSFVIFVVTLFGLKESRRIQTPGTSSGGSNRRENSASNTSAATLTEETPLLFNKADPCNHTEPRASSETVASQSAPDTTLRAILKGPLIITFTSYGLLAFLDMCHFSLLPLVYSTSPQLGGLGMSPYSIGLVLMTFGILNAFASGLLLGPLIKKFGARKMFSISMAFLPICFAMYPIMIRIALKSEGVNTYVMICIAIQLCCQIMDLIAYGSCQILLVQGVPDQHLGVVNGIAQMVGSAARAIGPTFASSLYSASLSHHLAGGNMAFYLLIALSSMSFAFTSRLRDTNAV